ncbi:efflux RND transporter periplasmic adaptor subunit [Candidatus Binatia bacterium]|nr:efflux RND transporter periplasmic adaptor subunit [Candidatus Binatia bacterium]
MASRQTMVKVAQAGIGIAVMVLSIMWMSGFFGHKIAPGFGAVAVPTAPADAIKATIVEESVPVVEEAAGTVQAERKTGVSARILAAIREIAVRAGDQVEKGAVLIRLDDRDLQARAFEARRAADAAEAAHRSRQADYDRAVQLNKQGIVSQGELDQAEAAYKIAAAELERAREGVRGADIALSYAEIAAPVSGRVVDRYADPGDTTVPGKPILALYDPSALRIEVPVRESLAVGIKPGDSLDVRIGLDGAVLRGVVDEIVPQAEAGSRTFLVKVGLPRGENVYTGMFGRLVIPAGQRARVLVPGAAVQTVGQLTFVTVVDAERRTSRRLVTLGPPAGADRFEVLSGLRPGEEVLVSGH